MERKERLRSKLEKMATAKANDAVRLAMMGEQALGLIAKMDLNCVSKLKRAANGAIELEFIDRMEALRWLCETADGDQREQAREFFSALGNAGGEAGRVRCAYGGEGAD